MDFRIIIYIIFGIAPSLIWLAYYLTKDLHPEPKRMILKIFLLGAVITIPVFFVQIGLKELLGIVASKFGVIGNIDKISSLPLNHLDSKSLTVVVIYWFLVISLSEEFFKYLVIRTKVIGSHHLDEPLDIMLYMVVAALGFAAVENVLYLIPTMNIMPFSRTLTLDLLRSVSAVFLHTLCSAVVGYSLAVSFCEAKRKYIITAGGILLAMLLHGLFDFSIMTLTGQLSVLIPMGIILVLAFLVFWGFERLKKMKSTCKIN